MYLNVVTGTKGLLVEGQEAECIQMGVMHSIVFRKR